MKLTRCDECKKECPGDNARLDWYTVSRDPCFSRMGHAEPFERNFCSHDCIAAFYGRQLKKGQDQKLAEHVRAL